MTDEVSTRPVVVVGVDGSPQATRALRWAVRYAEAFGARLRVVVAWRPDLGFGYLPSGTHSLEKEAEHTLSHCLDEVLGTGHTLEVERRVRAGNPTEVLLEESRDADLLVVGDRGYGGFAGLLLGSVSENCARHATCSVIIARDGA